MGLFDSIQKTVFKIAAVNFGYRATWRPLDNSPEQNATVLYKDATEKFSLNHNDFEIERYILEYHKGDFVGLFESAQQANDERIIISLPDVGEKEFHVKRVESAYDGKTIKAFLQPL